VNQIVSYSILKYTHSKVLGEELNVAILFVFPELKKAEIVFPLSIQRIKKTYPDASLEDIRSYLVSFKKQVKLKSKYIDKYLYNLEDFVSDYLITIDASSLQFSKFNHSLYIGNDIEKVKLDFYNFYLSDYESKHSEIIRKTDKSIIDSCKKLILSKRPEITDKLHDDLYIVKTEKISFIPDLYWQNGTLNLIKGVSLDYKEEDAIVDRALLVQNQLNHLEKEITSKKLRVDLLVSKPQNPDYIDAYKYAVELLESTTANNEVVEEYEIEKYTDTVASTIK